MNEAVVSLLSKTLNELRDVNSKIDDVKGIGVYSSLSDVCDKIESLETTITLGANY